MAWFRLQDGILDDPKIQHLPPGVFKDWINMLCLAKRHDGIIPNLKDVSFAFRVSEFEASEKLNELKKCGLIDLTKKGIMPHNWLKYQYKSDTSTKRVQQFRKRRETVSRNAPEQSRTDREVDKKESTSLFNRQFDEFWSACPRKVGKGAARKAYKAALKKTDHKKLLVGIVQYSWEVAGKDDEFVAHPATWLSGERWLDEPERKSHGNQHRSNGKKPSAHQTAYAAHAQAAGVPAGGLPDQDGPISEGAESDGNGADGNGGPDPDVPRLSHARQTR